MTDNEIINIHSKEISVLKETDTAEYNHYIRQLNSYLSENQLSLKLDSVLKYIREASEFYSLNSMKVLKVGIRAGIRETVSGMPYFHEFSLSIDEAFRKVKIGKPDPRISEDTLITEPEIDILLSGTEYFDKRKKQKLFIHPDEDIYYLVQFLKETGMRISEVLTVEKKAFVKKDGNYYFSFIGKGQKERKNFIFAELLEEIREHYSGNLYLFEYQKKTSKYSKTEKETLRKWISHKLNSYSKKVLGREINPHDFRHYFATRLLKSGKSLKAIAQWLGHSSTSITSDMYIHDELSPEDLY